VHCIAIVPYFQLEWRYAVMVASDRGDVTAWLSWVAVVLNLVLNLLWIPEYGALGSAWATLISYTVGGLVLTWFVADLRWLAKSQLMAMLNWVSWLWTPRQQLEDWRKVLQSGGTSSARI
jgi:Na+-driven multidrug efflux pump